MIIFMVMLMVTLMAHLHKSKILAAVRGLAADLSLTGPSCLHLSWNEDHLLLIEVHLLLIEVHLLLIVPGRVEDAMNLGRDRGKVAWSLSTDSSEDGAVGGHASIVGAGPERTFCAHHQTERINWTSWTSWSWKRNIGRETRAVLRRWTHCAHWTHWTRASPGSRRLTPQFVFGSSGHDVSHLSIHSHCSWRPSAVEWWGPAAGRWLVGGSDADNSMLAILVRDIIQARLWAENCPRGSKKNSCWVTLGQRRHATGSTMQWIENWKL